MTRSRFVALYLGSLLIVAAMPAAAQPYGAYFVKGSGHGYVEVPASSAFDFTTGFTFEAWVAGSDDGTCSSIARKNWNQAWGIGVGGPACAVRGGARTSKARRACSTAARFRRASSCTWP